MTNQDYRNARRFLTVNNIDKTDMSDKAILDMAIQMGWIPATPKEPILTPDPIEITTPAPITAPQPTPPTDTASALAAALTVAMASSAPHAPTVDESRIVELIKEHQRPQPHLITVKTVNTSITLTDEITHSIFEDCIDEISVFPNQLFLYGPSGAGKSHTAKQVTKSLDIPFFAMGAILVKYDILGSMTATSYHASTVRRWLESDTGLLCIDEIDSSCPRALVTIMSMFDDNGSITFPDNETFTRDASTHPIIVTANTTGNGGNHQYNGRAKLDAAFKARFIQLEHGFCQTLEYSFASELLVDYVIKFREELNSKGLEGSLVTPRHTKMLGERERLEPSKRQFAKSIKNVLKQGLTDTEYRSITASVGEY